MLFLAVVECLCLVQVENGMHEAFSNVSPNMGPLLAKTYQVHGSGGPFLGHEQRIQPYQIESGRVLDAFPVMLTDCLMDLVEFLSSSWHRVTFKPGMGPAPRQNDWRKKYEGHTESYVSWIGRVLVWQDTLQEWEWIWSMSSYDPDHHKQTIGPFSKHTFWSERIRSLAVSAFTGPCSLWPKNEMRYHHVYTGIRNSAFPSGYLRCKVGSVCDGVLKT